MYDSIYLIIGIIILVVVIYDFFFTTLSGSGAGFIANNISILSDRIIRFLVRATGRSAYDFNGLFVNFMVLSVWIILVWLGLFLLYSSNPEMITNSDGRIANNWERLYFTGYTLSTLGIGNFKPTSGFFEIVTSCFSFFGFIFFTSSMTYFISVSSAVINKRTLTKSIFNLGKNPQEIAKKLLGLDTSYSYQQFLILQEMINRHSANHHSYPVVHFYTHSKPQDCLSLNLARLDEALSIVLSKDNGGNLQKEMEPIRSSITNFLSTLDERFSKNLPKVKGPVETSIFPYQKILNEQKDLQDRRKTLERLLKAENFGWQDVV